MKRFSRSLLAILACSTLLSACGAGDFSDLDAFMAEKRARPGGIIAPIPTFKAYEAFSYSATTLRSPFDRPIEVREIAQLQAISAIKPDESRAKEFLEQFTFDSLRMVGSLERGQANWTLVMDPDGGVHLRIDLEPPVAVRDDRSGRPKAELYHGLHHSGSHAPGLSRF